MEPKPYSVSREADHIFCEHLLKDKQLRIPEKISAALWALATTFGNAIVRERFGVSQTACINADIASLFVMSVIIATVDEKPVYHPEIIPRLHRDNRFFHLHDSLNAGKSLTMLSLPLSNDMASSREDMFQTYASKVVEFDADWLDSEANEHWRQAGIVCLTENEFRASAQGQAIQNDGLYLIQPSDVGILAPVPYPNVKDASHRSLQGLRLLGLSRPDVRLLLLEGNLGKRDASIDLKSEWGRQTFRQLILDADIMLDGYWPGALERLGFGESYIRILARRRERGITVVRENCYRWHGPLVSRSGWQQISDCFTGVSWGMGQSIGLEEPIVPPLPNSDYQTGNLGLIGILTVVDRRANEGGSYTVSISLNQTNQFITSLGKLSTEVQVSLRALYLDFARRRLDEMMALVVKYVQAARVNMPTLSRSEYFDQKGCNFYHPERKLETLRFPTPPAKLDVTAIGYDIGSCLQNVYTPEWPART
ncbi:hypothetical protein COCMIDRAFT_39817 [Bipolaris oryzae ATCC 44560]|uniref:Uncharacterized protein n=1 Tax=Bipolaris oryzae ATCC 44560 TaxID=930090 RepID=W6ZF23_COCMI|nr:uncharacterized protein COCMIDRAFT_39817 [Bipolaris oryzae ATCC 44560]EUC42111.1 hypothetical protein COCMIDRAFT_39817 [Bipolaris oryzae ATCC 44560]